MAANSLQFETMRLKVGSFTVTCCLHDGGFHPDYGIWCATDGGGACCIKFEPDMIGGCLPESSIAEVLHLPTAEAVAQHVAEVALHYLPERRNRTLLLDTVVQTLTALALYPGYFTYDETEERRTTVIRAFVNAIAETGMRMPWCTFARFTYYLFLAYGFTPLHKHVLKHLPKSVAGLLVAYGLTQKGVWEERHMEVLEEGWRYQLAHPDDDYIDPFGTGRDVHLKPLIDSIEPSVAHQLLAATGVSDTDAARARDVAEALAGADVEQYTRAVLHYLTNKAQGREPGRTASAIELPTDLVS